MQQIGSTVFNTEVNTTPLTGKITVDFVRNNAVIAISNSQFSNSTNGQAVVKRGFAHKVKFTITTELSVITGISCCFIVIGINAIKFQIATEIQIDICSNSRCRHHSHTNKCCRYEQKFFH